MAFPWASVPPPGTSAQYGYPQGQYRSISKNLLRWSSADTDSTVNPAYHPVQVHQAFTQPVQIHYQHVNPPSTPATQQAPPQKKVDWPPTVRAYVQRSFDTSKSIPGVSRSEMEAKLKATITAASDDGTLHTTDWDNLPLPQQIIASQRGLASAQQPLMGSHTNGNSNGYGHGSKASKKRKSQEMGNADDEDLNRSTPPWRTTNTRNGFEDRISFQSPKERTNETTTKTSKFQKNLEKRQRRFDGGYKSTYARSPSPEPTVGSVVGTCQELEKKYFRLTAAPISSKVRPEYILRQTLELLKKKWKYEGNYSYICDQFKSMRQDLTVQHIKNEFTVTVYEIHARIALEKGDLGEYNQCQTQLRALYKQNLGGNPMEFKAYRILYFIHTANRTALNDALADLTPTETEQPAIKHALDVRSALALGNYHQFFRLYLRTPNMGAYLMDMFVVRERLAALACICKG